MAPSLAKEPKQHDLLQVSSTLGHTMGRMLQHTPQKHQQQQSLNLAKEPSHQQHHHKLLQCST